MLLHIKTAFLNAPLDLKLFVRNPGRLKIDELEVQAYLFFKALYVLCQRSWLLYQLLDQSIKSIGFPSLYRDPSVSEKEKSTA